MFETVNPSRRLIRHVVSLLSVILVLEAVALGQETASEMDPEAQGCGFFGNGCDPGCPEECNPVFCPGNICSGRCGNPDCKLVCGGRVCNPGCPEFCNPVLCPGNICDSRCGNPDCKLVCGGRVCNPGCPEFCNSVLCPGNICDTRCGDPDCKILCGGGPCNLGCTESRCDLICIGNNLCEPVCGGDPCNVGCSPCQDPSCPLFCNDVRCPGNICDPRCGDPNCKLLCGGRVCNPGCPEFCNSVLCPANFCDPVCGDPNCRLLCGGRVCNAGCPEFCNDLLCPANICNPECEDPNCKLLCGGSPCNPGCPSFCNDLLCPGNFCDPECGDPDCKLLCGGTTCDPGCGARCGVLDPCGVSCDPECGDPNCKAICGGDPCNAGCPLSCIPAVCPGSVGDAACGNAETESMTLLVHGTSANPQPDGYCDLNGLLSNGLLNQFEGCCDGIGLAFGCPPSTCNVDDTLLCRLLVPPQTADVDWFQPGGDLHTYLKRELFPDLYDRADYFWWSGGCRESKRVQAAEELIAWVNQHPTRKLRLIAHSHGCTVVSKALQLGLQADMVVYMSPLWVKQGEGNTLFCGSPTYLDVPNMANVTLERFYNIHAQHDRVVSDCAGARQNFSESPVAANEFELIIPTSGFVIPGCLGVVFGTENHSSSHFVENWQRLLTPVLRVDLLEVSAFADCMNGPGNQPAPSPPVTRTLCLDAFDLDLDSDVDLDDFDAVHEMLRRR